MTNDTNHTYIYDASNWLTQVDPGTTPTATYTYLGALRVKKIAGSTTTVYVYSGTKPIAEYAGGTLSKEYIYAGSGMLATVAADGTTTYEHPDHLSIRAESDSSGNLVRLYGHFPFGETWYEDPGVPAGRWDFAGYDRNSESGLDYVVFRSYSSRLGRFLGADPLAGVPQEPQSLNRYAYVRNDPCNYSDPLGLFRTSCTLTVNGGQLSSETKTTIETIFQDAGVSVSFVNDPQANLLVQLNVPLSGGVLGHNPPETNVAQINNARFWQLAAQASGFFPDVDHAIGVVISHELGHYLLQQSHPEVGNVGLMREGNDMGMSVFGVDPFFGQDFTPEQAEKIQQRCWELNHFVNLFATGGGGGGGNDNIIPIIFPSGYGFGFGLDDFGRAGDPCPNGDCAPPGGGTGTGWTPGFVPRLKPR